MKCLLFLLLLAAPLCAEPLPIANDAVRLDSDGNEIRCQGGSMLKIGDTWHWYGVDIEASRKNDSPLYHAVRCYTSRDLSRWKFAGVVFDTKGLVPNRVDVVYCAATKKYVMLSKHMDTKKGVGVSVSDAPAGPFVWHSWMELPDSLGGGDQSAFVDGDGKTYLVYTPWRRDPATQNVETNKHLTIVELTPDLTKVARVVCHLENTYLEAPAIFKRNGKYYWMNSSVAWWYSSGTSWSMADKLEGPWVPWKHLTARDPHWAGNCEFDSYNAQHDFVVRVAGTQGETFMFCGDRYAQFTKWGVGRVVWLPLLFDGDTPQMDWHRNWLIDTARGTWSPAAPNMVGGTP